MRAARDGLRGQPVQPVQPPLDEPGAPLAHRDLMHPQLGGDFLVVFSLRARQHDPDRCASACALVARRAQRVS